MEQGAEGFMAKWIAAEKVRARRQHAVVCPNVTGRTKKRIARSMRARAGSLVTGQPIRQHELVSSRRFLVC